MTFKPIKIPPGGEGTLTIRVEEPPTKGGRINKTWYNNCQINEDAESGQTIEGWFRLASNKPCEIDAHDLAVWDGTHWMRQDEIDRACKTIDAGGPAQPNRGIGHE